MGSAYHDCSVYHSQEFVRSAHESAPAPALRGRAERHLFFPARFPPHDSFIPLDHRMSGAFITVLVFWGIQKSALTGISHMGGLEFFLWTLCTFLISLFLFFGIVCISQLVSGMKKESAPESDQDPSGTQSDESGGKTDLLVLGVILSGVFLLLLWPAFLFTFYSPLHDENTAPGSST
jgi:hypothetical protein